MPFYESQTIQMARHAEQVDRPHSASAAATARLHTTVRPWSTSVASIAEEAGVTRLTVYRHFSDLDVLFEACRAHWRVEYPPPFHASGRRRPVSTQGTSRAHGFLAWYREHADELFPNSTAT